MASYFHELKASAIQLTSEITAIFHDECNKYFIILGIIKYNIYLNLRDLDKKNLFFF